MPFFMVGLPHTAALSRHVMAVTWRRFLFPFFCDQYNHKGQNRKNDHEKFIISHTLTPFFGKSGGESSAGRSIVVFGTAVPNPRFAPRLQLANGFAVVPTGHPLISGAMQKPSCLFRL